MTHLLFLSHHLYKVTPKDSHLAPLGEGLIRHHPLPPSLHCPWGSVRVEGRASRALRGPQSPTVSHRTHLTPEALTQSKAGQLKHTLYIKLLCLNLFKPYF